MYKVVAKLQGTERQLVNGRCDCKDCQDKNILQIPGMVAGKMHVSKTEAAPPPWRRVKEVSAAIAEASSAGQSGSKGYLYRK